jgi:hypothetical protein
VPVLDFRNHAFSLSEADEAKWLHEISYRSNRQC